jgi:hypothetical protein
MKKQKLDEVYLKGELKPFLLDLIKSSKNKKDLVKKVNELT